jgi:histone H4
MSGRGKGASKHANRGTRRHRRVLHDAVQGITKPAIRRLARRGGVKRINGGVYEETRGVLKVFLENIIREAVIYTEHARRKTVTALDCVSALKRQGHMLYGFGDTGRRFQSKSRPPQRKSSNRNRTKATNVRGGAWREQQALDAWSAVTTVRHEAAREITPSALKAAQEEMRRMTAAVKKNEGIKKPGPMGLYKALIFMSLIWSRLSAAERTKIVKERAQGPWKTLMKLLPHQSFSRNTKRPGDPIAPLLALGPHLGQVRRQPVQLESDLMVYIHDMQRVFGGAAGGAVYKSSQFVEDVRESRGITSDIREGYSWLKQPREQIESGEMFMHAIMYDQLFMVCNTTASPRFVVWYLGPQFMRDLHLLAKVFESEPHNNTHMPLPLMDIPTRWEAPDVDDYELPTIKTQQSCSKDTPQTINQTLFDKCRVIGVAYRTVGPRRLHKGDTDTRATGIWPQDGDRWGTTFYTVKEAGKTVYRAPKELLGNRFPLTQKVTGVPKIAYALLLDMKP